MARDGAVAGQAGSYRCRRISAPVHVDGDLTKPPWADAVRTPRFQDIQDGLALLDTRAALLWDDAALYIGLWLEERDVWSTNVERSGPVWQENTAVVNIAGPDAQYSLAVNAQGRRSELFLIWKDAYQRGGQWDIPEFDVAIHQPMVLGGDARPRHPRGMRWLFFDWSFPGLECRVHVDGTVENREDIDQGWTVELAFPWEGMRRLSNHTVPPRPGDCWRINLGRTQVIDQRGARHTAVWAWPVPAGRDLLDPDGYPPLEFIA